MPKISILTSTYKRPWGLLGAIRCVQAQTFRDYEHIIIGDHCPQAKAVIQTVGDDKAVFHNLSKNSNDLGVTPLNTALKMADGEWVAVLADDNLWTADHLKRLTDAIEGKDDIGFVYGCCIVRHKGGRTEGYPAYRDEPWPHWAGIDLGECLYRRSLFEKYGPWEYGENYSYDWRKIEQFLRGGEKWLHVPDCWTYIFYVG